MRDSFLDKIRENKTTLIWIGVIAAIAVVVSALMITGLASSKGAYDADIMGLEADSAQASASINTLGTNLNDRIDDVEASAQTATDEAGIIGVATTENSDAIATLQAWKGLIDPRLTVLAANITSLNTWVGIPGANFTTNSTNLNTWVGNLSANLTALWLNFTALSTDLANLGANATCLIGNLTADLTVVTDQVNAVNTTTNTNCHAIGVLQDWADTTDPRITTLEEQNSPPEGYLTGTVGNYTLHAECSEAGDFTANVHLAYSTPISVGNTTYSDALVTFHGSLSTPNRVYVPTITYNGTHWLVSQVWFNIGTFAMTANNETPIGIIFSGLDSAYNPDFAYVEVWPVLK